MEKLNELVELAKKATPGRNPDRLESCGGGIKYQCLGDDGSLVLQCDHKNDEYGFIGPKSLEDEGFFLACNPDTILAIAEAFRALEKNLAEVRQYNLEYAQREVELEQRAEAAEAKLSALQDGFAEAIRHKDKLADELAELAKQESTVEVTVDSRGEDHYTFTINRILPDGVHELFTRPAPAADLAALVPPEADGSNLPFAANGWNACRAEMLRKIEEAK